MRWHPADADLWRRLADADPTATYFQTPAWAELARSILPGIEACAVQAEVEGAGRVVVPAMKTAVGRGLYAMVESMPPGVYGGPLVESGAGSIAGPESFRTLFEDAGGGVTVSSGPFRSVDLGWDSETRTTHVLDLEGVDEDGLLRGYRKGHRSAVKKATRDGVSVDRARTAEDFDVLRALYDDTRERWTRTPWVVYGDDLFDHLRTRAEADDRVRVFLARREGRSVGAAVVLRQGRHAGYWVGATSDEGRRLNAGNLVVHRAIVDAVEDGAAVFDFLPSGGLEAVERFKSGYGASIREFTVHRRPPALGYRAVRATGRLLRGDGG